MADQSTSKEDSEVDKGSLTKLNKNKFKWTKEVEKKLLSLMIDTKSNEIQKHLNILLIQEHMMNKYMVAIPTSLIWEFLNSNWDMKDVDILENLNFDISSTCTIPEEYREFIKEQNKILSRAFGKKNENLKLSEDSKVSTLQENCLNNINKIGSEDVISKKSLSTIDQPEIIEVENDSSTLIKFPCENNKANKLKKSNSVDLTNDKHSRKTKNLKNDKIPTIGGKKRKIYDKFESKLISNNSKQPHDNKKNSTMLDKLSMPQDELPSTSVTVGTSEKNDKNTDLQFSSEDEIVLENVRKKYGEDLVFFLPIIKIKKLKIH